jgi:D-xylose 1-dehydrogenase (NADP+, D-xylono-1,5-lactone-forming)
MIRFGILGTARIARAFFRHPLEGVEFTAIASRNPGRAAEFARECGIPRVFDSYEQLLADPAIDAVYIPLPQHLHAEYCIKAAEKGKHMLVEKPAALNGPELRSVIGACRTHGVLFMEAFMYRFLRVHNRAKEIVEQGTIGPLRYVDFNLSVNAGALRLGGSRFDPALGGGAIYDRGIYGADFLRFMTGSKPKLVRSHMQRDRDTGVDVFTSALYEIGDIAASLTVGFTFDANYYMLAGELGSVYNPVSISGRYDPQLLTIHLHEGNRRYEETFAADMPYKWELEYFGRCVAKGEQPFLGPENSLGNMEMIEDLFRESVEW